MLYFSNAKHSLRRGLQGLAVLTCLEMSPVLQVPTNRSLFGDGICVVGKVFISNTN